MAALAHHSPRVGFLQPPTLHLPCCNALYKLREHVISLVRAHRRCASWRYHTPRQGGNLSPSGPPTTAAARKAGIAWLLCVPRRAKCRVLRSCNRPNILRSAAEPVVDQVPLTGQRLQRKRERLRRSLLLFLASCFNCMPLLVTDAQWAKTANGGGGVNSNSGLIK